MIELGKMQRMLVSRKATIGLYLSPKDSPADEVLLPNKDIPAGTDVGDEVEVFIYKDSEDRLVATSKTPKLTLDEIAFLKVNEVTKIGAFLDWGLPKDLLLPYREQTDRVKEGKEYLVGLYIDNSERLCATTRIYDFLRTDSPYQKGDRVTGIVYDADSDIGALVAVDNKFNGLIPKQELVRNFRNGDTVEVRVTNVREDGKLDLSLKERIHVQMDKDAQKILDVLDQRGGTLNLDDKSPPEDIKRQLGMSKGAFKKAVGKLLKEKNIEFVPGGIKRI